MDKFLVDLDSVLDKLEAEDADRCAKDEIDDDSCTVVGSSTSNYRNSSDNKSKQASDGGTHSINHRSHYQQYRESKIVNDRSTSVGGFGGITGNNRPDLSPSQPKSSKICYNENDSLNRSTSDVNQQPVSSTTGNKNLGKSVDPVSETAGTSSSSGLLETISVKSSVSDRQSAVGLDEVNKPEPGIVHSIGAITSDSGASKKKKGLDESNNSCDFDGNGGSSQLTSQQQLNLLDESYHSVNRIQQSVNLDPNFNNEVNYRKPESEREINQEKIEIIRYSNMDQKDCFASNSYGSVPQTKSRPSEEQDSMEKASSDPSSSFHSSGETNVVDNGDFGDLEKLSMMEEPQNLDHLYHLGSSLTSSQTLGEANLLDNPTGLKTDSNVMIAESSDEEMTEEEEKALEKELESELKRLSGHLESSSHVVGKEDGLKPEIAQKLSLTSKTVSSSPPSSSPSTATITSSPSTPSQSTSSSSVSVSLSLSKSNEMSNVTNRTQSTDQPSESHQSPPSLDDSSTVNTSEPAGNDIIDEWSSNDTNCSGNFTLNGSKPVRPATLPIANPGQVATEHSPIHDLAQQSASTSTEPSLVSIPNSQVERDIVPENVQASTSGIGYFKPYWIPDEDAPFCMICDTKFTVVKRRHHCRACGKVLCAQCSRGKAPLAYLAYVKARVCNHCLPLLIEGEHNSGQDNSLNDSGCYQVGQQQHPLGAEGLPTPNDPPLSPYQLSASASTTTTAASLLTGATGQSSSSSNIQPISVLRRPSKPRTGEPKQVIFSDGIRPGNDLKDDQVTSVSHRRHAKKVKSPPIEKNPSSPGFSSSSSKSRLSRRIVIHDANDPLPPIINAPSNLQLDPSFDNLMSLLAKEDELPITFSLTKNLMALVKLVKLDCCTNQNCWTFTSKNLSAVGQDEIIIVLQQTPDENVIPRDIFRLFAYIYDSASKGAPFSESSHLLYQDGFFGLKDFPSFLFIRPTFQCLNKLTLPPAPFLIGILIHRFEVPWAKLFPLRLILRLGAAYTCYPCPVISYRSRRPCYFEIGHTVMDILADFRNFTYTLPVIPGLTIHTEAKRTTVTFPKNRYDKVMKALGSSNEYVLTFGGTFSLTADSHLTCIQNDDGLYHTKTISLPGNEPKITGVSFIVFSGALKSSTGMMAKMNIVEDGLLVQVTANTLNLLKTSLRDMNDFAIECGKKDNPTSEESVSIVWSEDDKQFNLGVRSCIDGLSLEGINSIRMYNGTDFEGDKYLIRWVELFLIQNTELPRSSDGYDAGRAAEIIAQSFCPAMVPCLESLVESKITKIGLRVTLDSEKVGYDVGSNASPLPSIYVDRLDAALIPIIMGNIAPNMEVRLVIELIFYILVK